MWPRRAVKAILVTLLTVVVCALTMVGQVPGPDGSTPAGTIISNRAEASYLNEAGELITTVSETVTITVGTVPGLSVTPDDSAASSTHTPQERITKVFRVCNTGNMADSFKVKSADVNAPAALVALYFDLDENGIVSAGDTPRDRRHNS